MHSSIVVGGRPSPVGPVVSPSPLASLAARDAQADAGAARAVGARTGHGMPDGPPTCNTGVKHLAYYIHAGVDYIRLTCKEENTATRLALVARSVAAELEQEGEKVSPQRLYGYDGWSCGGLFYGERYDGICFQASGLVAAAVWRDVAQHVGNVNMTRLDLQVTAQLQELPDGYFRSVADGSAAASAAWAERGRPWRVSYIDGYGNGDTVYVGSKSSAQFGRVYDKHKESAGGYPEGSVRYELQVADEHAVALFESVAGVCDGLDSYITNYVASWFARRGVRLPVMHQPTETISIPRPPSGAERSLRWLEKQVKPTVERLAALGRGDDTMQALGIAVSKARDGLEAALARIADKRRAAVALAPKFDTLPPVSDDFHLLQQLARQHINGFTADECRAWWQVRGLAVS